MQKTAAEIANYVLTKVAAEESAVPTEPSLGKLLTTGALSAVSPLAGGGAAAAMAPKGSRARQFGGAFGGGVLGAVPAAIIGTAFKNDAVGRALTRLGAGGGSLVGSKLVGYNPPKDRKES
jgi:hypothetical protein